MIKKIAIIGAGNGGLFTAIALTQSGFQVQLFEKHQYHSTEGGGIGLWPNGIAMIDKLGLYSQLIQWSSIVDPMRVGMEDGTVLREVPGKAYHAIAPFYPITIERSHLLKILLSAFPAENIHMNKKLINIEESAHAVELQFADNTRFSADLVIGADGAFSKVRQYVCGEIDVEYNGYVCLGGILSRALPLDLHLIYGEGFSLIFPTINNRHLCYFAKTIEKGTYANNIEDAKELVKVLRNNSRLINILLDEFTFSLNNRLENYFCLESYRIPYLPTWTKGRVVLMGDAAHLMGPLNAFATSLAFEDGYYLAKMLKSHPQDIFQALDKYQTHRIPRIKAVGDMELQAGKDLVAGYSQGINQDNREFIEVLRYSCEH